MQTAALVAARCGCLRRSRSNCVETPLPPGRAVRKANHDPLVVSRSNKLVFCVSARGTFVYSACTGVRYSCSVGVVRSRILERAASTFGLPPFCAAGTEQARSADLVASDSRKNGKKKKNVFSFQVSPVGRGERPPAAALCDVRAPTRRC